jgi:UDP-N-acetylmuramate dehydrogenase
VGTEAWLQRGVALAPLTTWKIGGPAELYAAPETVAGLREAIVWGQERGLPLWILGRGSNVLIDDNGLPGLTLCLRHLQLPEATVTYSKGEESSFLTVPAGISLPRLAKLVAKAGYTGYEFYIGIPGTVGGAVVMNAGFGPGDERQTANRCIAVAVLDAQGRETWQEYTHFQPRYRWTSLQEGNKVVTAARFALNTPAPSERIRRETAEHLAMRKRMQPLTRPTAGSVFKGTAEGVPAGRLIDECGLKGLQVGGAMVSHKHANWIENLGDARAADVRELVALVQESVQAKRGIFLETEVNSLGDTGIKKEGLG